MRQHRLGFFFVNIEPPFDDFLVRVIEAVVFQRALFQTLEQRLAIGAGKMKNFFHVDHVFHDLRLLDVSRNSVEHENVDVGFEFMSINRGINRYLPKLDRDVVRHELTFARVFEKRFADWRASVDRTKNVSARAMKVTRNAAECFALSALTAPWSAEQNERAVFHEAVRLYRTRGESGREVISPRPGRYSRDDHRDRSE